jgi:hypothetical protein
MRRRAAVEPVIGHLKDPHRMRCNYLKGRDGDRINAVLAAGFNFSLSLGWFAELLRVLLLILCRHLAVNFQEVVHSDPTVNADVAKQAVIRRGTEWTLTRMRL